jgi:6-phosphogluconate dehydrogenase
MEINQLGYIGLGRMGANMVMNLLDKDFDVVAYDQNQNCGHQLGEERKEEVETEKLQLPSSLEEVASALDSPKVIWMMVPAGKAVDGVITSLLPELSPKDILIDGGNSYFKDSMRRAHELKEKGINYLDIGTSGGLKGARNGACLTIGGEREVYEQLEQLFKAISAPQGYLYTGPSGTGHFVKMMHNFIEYGIEKCIGEGVELVKEGGDKFWGEELNLGKICGVWNKGSIIESKLMGYLADAFNENEFGSNLEHLSGKVGGGETGEWALATTLELNIPASCNALALLDRYRSRQDDSFAGKCIAGMRNVFGGHKIEYKKREE